MVFPVCVPPKHLIVSCRVPLALQMSFVFLLTILSHIVCSTAKWGHKLRQRETGDNITVVLLHTYINLLVYFQNHLFSILEFPLSKKVLFLNWV